MLRIASQTARPIGPNFFVDTKGGRVIGYKIEKNQKKIGKLFFFHGQRRSPGPSASNTLC